MNESTQRLIALDHAHLWHPFTPMRQWRNSQPLVIEKGQGEFLFDTEGNRYIDGISSLWCNVHGHHVPALDQALRDQLDKVAHSTLLGHASVTSIELAAQLVQRAARPAASADEPAHAPTLTKVFYSDAGATALEAAFKMAIGYWYYQGQPAKNRFIGFQGAYHGDTTGSMSVGYSDFFHRPFAPMVFPVRWAPAPDSPRAPEAVGDLLRKQGMSLCPTCRGGGDCGLTSWPSECMTYNSALREYCLMELEKLLAQHAHETAAIVLEPIMQGAAGMICQPLGFVRGVARLAKKYNVLFIADEVAVGFGRTGKMFACHHETDEQFPGPDILCMAKGITAGYLPLAATLTTDAIYDAFDSPPENAPGSTSERRAFYHGHTYTGNALACAVALASLQVFDSSNLMTHINQSARIITDRLQVLRDLPHVLDVRQRGIMVGIELCKNRERREPLDYTKRTGAALCLAMREKGLIVRPLGDVLVLMPIPAMPHSSLERMLDIVIQTLQEFRA